MRSVRVTSQCIVTQCDCSRWNTRAVEVNLVGPLDMGPVLCSKKHGLRVDVETYTPTFGNQCTRKRIAKQLANGKASRITG
jgi:hypothetical protein